MQPSVVIGRGKGTDLLLPDISVSRHHARVDRQGEEGHVLVDLGSQNGTKVNGQKVKEHVLQPGDELQIGKFLLTYEFKPVRSIDDASNTTGVYNLDEERTGFLDKVSAVEGTLAHATTMLSKEEMDTVRRQARLKENGKVVQADTGDSWKIGDQGLRFGKGGIQIQGGGMGGVATILWSEKEHILQRESGLFFSVSVNGTKVTDSRPLQPGDQLVLGKTAFQYIV